MAEIAPTSRRARAWLVPAFAALVFAFLSLAILPYPGLQDDEVLFTGPFYDPGLAHFNVKLWGATIPFMLMSYLGTLKTWLYSGIFEWFEPSRWSVRAPMVLMGVVTVWLTWLWTRRAAGTRAAAFTVALLSTDAIFIMTNTLDWGPVALQHVLLMGGLLAVQVWLGNEAKYGGSRWMLALGFFLWGLGLWDKALFIWPLFGLAVGALCVYPGELLRRLRPVPIAIAAVSLLIGALPLVWYNIARPGETASGNAKLSAASMPGKVFELRHTLDGSLLLDSMVSTTPGPVERAPKTAVERVSLAVKSNLGEHRSNWMLPAIALALACMVYLLRTPAGRPLVFVLIAMAVAWLQMALNAGTGGSAHHVILLWPFPCVFVGTALAGVADRAPRYVALAMNGLIVAIACAGVLNVNEYLANLIVNGAVGGWTDASYRLAGAVAPYRSDWIGGVDWGYMNGLRMWYEGDLKLFAASDLVRKPALTEDARRQLLTAVQSPGFAFIQHTDDKQMFPGVNGQFRAAALALGYTEQVERVVHDNEGRPVFEIFRFVKTGQSM